MTNGLKGDLARLESENELLRGELKRLAQMTKEKILDLQNNINGISMLKEHEGDNYEMEKNKVITNRDFVIEQMKAQFNERSKKVENEIQMVEQERSVLLNEAKTLQEELRNFQVSAEHRVKNEMTEIVEKEQIEHNKQIKEIESQLNNKEEEIRATQNKIQDQIHRFQAIERENQSKLSLLSGELQRRREEIDNVETQYNKQWVVLDSQEKELQTKRSDLNSMGRENEVLVNKRAKLEEMINNEQQNLERNQRNWMEDSEIHKVEMLKEESRLMGEIESKKEELLELQKKQTQMFEMVEKNLNSAIDNQFKEY